MDGPLFVTLIALGAAARQSAAAPADDTGRMIALVIAALLGLALLLGVLTFWYWRRTDPRKAVRPAPAPTPVTAADGAGAGRGRSAGSGAPRPATGAAARPRGGEGTTADRGISAEEWLRLTGSRQSAPRDRT